MTNVFSLPNLLKIHLENTTVTHSFGELRSTCRVPHPQSTDVIRVEFAGRVGLELTPLAAMKLAEALSDAALSATTLADCSGAVGYSADEDGVDFDAIAARRTLQATHEHGGYRG